ncbi:MAG: hypothetical protein ACRCY5_07580, partial [Phocaeicola sp.]
DKGKIIQRTIFSTDTYANPTDVLDCYHARFQIEFLYRDAKQATGLTHCQARSLEKLNAHFNFALTGVNIAKVVHWRNSKNKHIPFSIKDAKILLHNQMMVNLFISKFGINPNSKKNHKLVKELLTFVIYENMNSMYANKLTGTFAINAENRNEDFDIISGEYDYDGGSWANAYKLVVFQESMTWTVENDPMDVSIYERCNEIPKEILDGTARSLPLSELKKFL